MRSGDRYAFSLLISLPAFLRLCVGHISLADLDSIPLRIPQTLLTHI